MLLFRLLTGQQNSQTSSPSIKVQAKTVHLTNRQMKKKKPLNTKKLFTYLEEVALKPSLTR